jgi:hypothetical protein
LIMGGSMSRLPITGLDRRLQRWDDSLHCWFQGLLLEYDSTYEWDEPNF